MWALTVGGTDVSQFVLNGASFSEIASSASGKANFSINGSFGFAIGNPVLLTNSDGNVAWEGFVSAISLQQRADGSTTSTLITASSNAALFEVGATGGSYQNTDVASVAQLVALNAGVPWGGPTSFGIEIGSLTFASADDALSTLATLAQSAWGVRGGQLQFVSPWLSGIIAVPVVFNTVSNAVYVIDVLGGVDASTRLPLAIAVNGLGVDSGQTCYVNQPEIGDTDTLAVYAGTLAEWYGAGSITGQAVLPTDTTIRAGDWLEDLNGSVAVAYSTTYTLVGGALSLNVQLGFPVLPQNRQYSIAFAESVARQPAARLHTDCVVSGCDATLPGNTDIAISAGTIILGGSTVSLSGQTLTLPVSGSFMVEANASGFFYTNVLSAPAPGSAVMLYQATTFNGTLLQNMDIRSFGGVGTMQLKPATPGAPSVTLNSITLTGEGATSVLATVTFTVNGVTLDDTIQSIDVSWSIAGKNQWHPRIPAVHSPNSPTVTAYIHGLAAGQGYDLGVTVRGHNGLALNANPMLLGTSPTVSAQAINLVLNLDQINDGTTYKRVKATELSNNTVARLNDGTNIRTAANVAAIVDQVGAIPSTIPWKNNIPNALSSLLSNVAVSWSATSSSVSIWMTDVVGTGLPSWEFPDGTQINAPAGACGSSGSPLVTVGSLGTSQHVYFVIWYNLGPQTFTVQSYTPNPPTTAQAAPSLQDGQLLCAMANANTTQAPVAGGGGGTWHGGGGGHSFY